MVRFLMLGVLSLWLLLGTPVPNQQEPAPEQPQDQYFSGTVTAIDGASMTVTRTVLGAEATTKTFAITRETRMEGKPKVKSRVTVRFLTADGADRAIHILVRPGAKK